MTEKQLLIIQRRATKQSHKQQLGLKEKQAIQAEMGVGVGHNRFKRKGD